MKFLRDLCLLFFYLGNVNKKKVSLRDIRKDINSHKEKYANKPVDIADKESKDFINKVEQETSQSWNYFMSNMIWIGSGSQVLIAQIMLSDKLSKFHSLFCFKTAFFFLSTSLVLSLSLFISSIISGEFTMSAYRASKQFNLEIENAK